MKYRDTDIGCMKIRANAGLFLVFVLAKCDSQASASNAEWTPWSCCKGKVDLQSRQRILNPPRIEVVYQSCSKGYCQASECRDTSSVCQLFTRYFGIRICNPTNSMSTFMSHNCPVTCNYCSYEPTSTGQTTTPVTTRPRWQPQTTTATQAISVPVTPVTTRPPWQPPTTTRRPLF